MILLWEIRLGGEKSKGRLWYSEALLMDRMIPDDLRFVNCGTNSIDWLRKNIGW